MADMPGARDAFAVPAPPIPSLPVAGSALRFPVRRIHCVGRNYLAHVKELGNDEKALPVFFAKAPDMIVQSGTTVPYPPLTHDYHHEVELVVAIGRPGANIAVERAREHVFGYAVGLDMTRRDLQKAASKAGRPWEVGKSFDHAAPCGAVHPASAVGHVTRGRIHLSVNGQTRQDSDINLMMWDVAAIIHHLSLQAALEPGDLIFTGTPDGVGPVVAGDEIVAAIDGLGDLWIRIG
jgi:fumarylpyruvate hydrolase